MIPRRFFLLVLITALSVFLFGSCDLSSLFGKKQSPQYLSSYAVTASQNPGLSQDEPAIMNGTDIYITLPYLYAVDGVAVTPAVGLQAGASVSPGGTYVVHDDMPLAVSANGTTYTYTLHVAVDPNTIALPPFLESFDATAAQNTVLSQDADAVIYGNGVYITLPYSVITEQLPLTPTITLAPGYTISPTGTYPFINNTTLEVTNTSTAQLYDYHLYVAADPSTSPPLPPLQTYAFTFTAAQNSTMLTTDADGVIDGTDIFVTLPYTSLQNQTPLTPSVQLESGYTISPSGSYVPTDGMTLVVIDTATSGVTDYTLHVAVATSTIP